MRPPYYTQAIGQVQPLSQQQVVPLTPMEVATNGNGIVAVNRNRTGYGAASGLGALWGLASLAGSVGGVYHGYKRNQSIGWALVWGFFGGMVPIIVLPLAAAQGFGERKAGR